MKSNSTRVIRKSIEANNNLIERAKKNAEVIDAWYEKKRKDMPEAFAQVTEEKLLPIKDSNGIYSLENLESNMSKVYAVQEKIDAKKTKEKKESKKEKAKKVEEAPVENKVVEEPTDEKAIPLY